MIFIFLLFGTCHRKPVVTGKHCRLNIIYPFNSSILHAECTSKAVLCCTDWENLFSFLLSHLLPDLRCCNQQDALCCTWEQSEWHWSAPLGRIREKARQTDRRLLTGLQNMGFSSVQCNCLGCRPVKVLEGRSRGGKATNQGQAQRFPYKASQIAEELRIRTRDMVKCRSVTVNLAKWRKMSLRPKWVTNKKSKHASI